MSFVVPRKSIASLTVGGSSKGFTAVHILTKDAIAARFGGAQADDAAKDGVVVTYENGSRVLLAAAGKKLSVDGVKKAAVAAVNKLRALKLTEVEFVLPAVEGAAPAKVAEALAQAASLTNYSFNRYITVEDKQPVLLSAIHVVAEASAEVEEAVRVARIMADATIFARDMANERADEMHPARLEAIAREIAAETGAAVSVVTGEELSAAGLNMFYAVGQAARVAPRYIEILHAGDPANPSDIIMVLGKGITFDSGGLNIKGTGFMEDMHMDMAGSAAALGSALAAGRLGIKRNILFVAAAAENAIDALSYKPHAIITSHKGLTVEIGNTDAEGRLVLSDALSFAQARHKPHTIIDMATLTGACIVGLGEYAAGLFTNSKPFAAALASAAETRGERLWPMPILPEHEEELTTTPFADMKSTGAGRYGGACTAAAFIKRFIGDKDGSYKPAWCHIDLAGPAMYSAPRGYMPKGGTGFGVHATLAYLLAAPAGPLAADE